MRADEGPGFSRRIDVGRLRHVRHVEKIAASEAERTTLARRFDLQALNSLEAELTLSRTHGGLICVDGALRAEVAQICVVTLASFTADVQDSFQLFFREVPDESGQAQNLNVDVIDPMDDEAFPEPVDGSFIDLGEIVAQQLSLALDPYPRAPGAELENVEAGTPGLSENPFRALADNLTTDKGGR